MANESYEKTILMNCRNIHVQLILKYIYNKFFSIYIYIYICIKYLLYHIVLYKYVILYVLYCIIHILYISVYIYVYTLKNVKSIFARAHIHLYL